MLTILLLELENIFSEQDPGVGEWCSGGGEYGSLCLVNLGLGNVVYVYILIGNVNIDFFFCVIIVFVRCVGFEVFAKLKSLLLYLFLIWEMWSFKVECVKIYMFVFGTIILFCFFSNGKTVKLFSELLSSVGNNLLFSQLLGIYGILMLEGMW